MKNNSKNLKGQMGNAVEKSVRQKQFDSIKELMKRNSPQARTEIIRYVAMYPADMYGFYLYGKIFQQHKDYDEAKRAFSIVAASTSKNRCSGLVGLADIARLEGRYQEAKAYYRQVIQESSYDEAYSKLSLARIERIEGHSGKALSILKTINNPTTSSKMEQAKILASLGEIEQAEEILNTIESTTPYQTRELSYEKAKIARRSGDYAKAKYCFLEAKGNGVKDALYHLVVKEEARLAVDLGDYQEAIDCCEELDALGATLDGSTHIIWGNAYAGLGDYKRAYENYKIASQSQRGDIRSTGLYLMGTLQQAAGNFAEAEHLIKSSLIKGENVQASIKGALTSLYIKQKKYQEAETYVASLGEARQNERLPSDLEIARLFLTKVTGRPLPNRSEQDYTHRQIIEYNKEEALAHTIDTCNVKNKFSSIINITELFDDIRVLMTDDNKINNSVFDVYEIDYPNAGYSPNGEIINRIRVVTIPETLDIITMYPSSKNKTPRQGEVRTALGNQSNDANARISKFNSRFANFIPPKA